MANDNFNTNENLIYRLNYEPEIHLFSEKHQRTLKILNKINDTVDFVFRRSVMSSREEITIFMLGRLCARHFESILLLCMNGHGFSAFRILRSMFEKYVDSAFLHKYPEQIEIFWNYKLVQEYRNGNQNLDELDENWKEILETYKRADGKFRVNWSKETFHQKAKKIKADNWIIEAAYGRPNQFVHTTVDEIFSSLIHEKDGTISPVESVNEQERRFADIAYTLSVQILFKVMELQIEHYGWKDAEEIFNSLLESYAEALQRNKV